MKVGDVVGQEIFDFDLGLSSNDDVRWYKYQRKIIYI
jgi:hypothetical protein